MKHPFLIIILFSISSCLPGILKAMNTQDRELFEKFLENYTYKDRILSNLQTEINIIQEDKLTLLQKAALEKNEIICCKLLEMGANPNVRYLDDKPALLIAIGKHLSKASCLMIQKGAYIYISDNKSTTLQLACKENLTDVCLMLIAKGASVESKEFTYTHPLQTAIDKDNYRVCRALLRRNAPMGSKLDKRLGATPSALRYAARDKRGNACRAILAHTLFQSKEPIFKLLLILRRMRQSQLDCPSLLYSKFKELMARPMLYILAIENRNDLIQKLEHNKHFKDFPIDLLDIMHIDQTIQVLVKEELDNIQNSELKNV